MTIVLFDIDGTLIRTGRAGSRAMNRAFEDLFGIRGRVRRYSDGGPNRQGDSRRRRLASRRRSQRRELSALSRALFRPADGSASPELRLRSSQRACCQASGRCSKRSRSRDDVFPALLTGNCEEGARIKLQHFDLWNFFRCGAFGDEVSIATTCLLWLSSEPWRAAPRRCGPTTCSSSAIPCWTSPAQKPQARDRSLSQPGHRTSIRFRRRVRMLSWRISAIRPHSWAVDEFELPAVPEYSLKYDDVVGKVRRRGRLGPAPSGAGREELTFYETDVSGARPLLRFLRSELDALTFAEQLENGAADGAAMKEVLDSAFIADKPETLVDQEPCDRAGRHTRVLRMFSPGRKVAVTSWRSGLWELSPAGNGASVGASPYEVKTEEPAMSPLLRRLPRRVFLVFVRLGILVKVFIFKDFVVFVVGLGHRVHGLPARGYGVAGFGAVAGAAAGAGRRAGLRGVSRPVVAAAFLTHPELIRLPWRSRRRIPQIHLIAASLAANRYSHFAHAAIL